jgi:sugar lactone lactonase YvrE
VLTDILPAGSQFVSASGSGWNCSQSKGTITCSAESLAPGVSLITILAKAPASGTAHNTASVMSIGSIDPNPKNDNAALDTLIYDPAVCTAAASQLIAPDDARELATGAVDLSWSPVAGATRYRLWSAVEGAKATVVAESAGLQLHRDAEVGWTEWWVEAVFDACPPVASQHRHFLSHGPAAVLNVSTLAGRSDSVGDDDGTLDTARFRTPSSIGVDLDGNIYVADSEASTIRRIAPDGKVNTPSGIAGQIGSSDGTPGFSRLNHPRALTVTAGGYVYIADTENHTIRQFYPSGNGVISSPFLVTLAGTTLLPGAVDGNGGNARFNRPAGIAVASNGTVYVADTGSNLARQVVGLNAVVSTVARDFNAPSGIAVDSAGNVFVADTNNNVIKKIARDGAVTTFAGVPGQPGLTDGLGVIARFNHPTALAFDAVGNLYVADTGNNAIRKIAPSTLVSTVVSPAMLNAPGGLAFDSSGRMLIADSGNHLIRIAVGAPPPPARHRSVQH